MSTYMQSKTSLQSFFFAFALNSMGGVLRSAIVSERLKRRPFVIHY